MELKKSVDKGILFIKKYRYAFLILLIGLVLMAIPGTKDKETVEQAPSESTPRYTLEQRLSEALSLVAGAGRVRVVLSEASGAETIYQTDTHYANSENSTSNQSDTVTVTNSQRTEGGLIKQVNPEIYRGAVVICDGADNPSVRLAITDAVSNATGLGADRISIMKMK